MSLRSVIVKPVRRYTASAGSLSPAPQPTWRARRDRTRITRCRQGRSTETGITERRANEEVVDERHEPAILHPVHERDDHVPDLGRGLLDEPDSPEPRIGEQHREGCGGARPIQHVAGFRIELRHQLDKRPYVPDDCFPHVDAPPANADDDHARRPAIQLHSSLQVTVTNRVTHRRKHAEQWCQADTNNSKSVRLLLAQLAPPTRRVEYASRSR